MSKGDLSVYRSPAEGFSPEPQLVPDLTPWRCRWFGHSLRGRYEREHNGDFQERSDAERGKKFYAVVDYPSAHVHSSAFETVWCARCGREWKRDKAKK